MRIVQPSGGDKHQDSIWYDGLIAETEHYELVAAGEVRINRSDKNGDYLGMYDGKSRDDFGQLNDDDDLRRILDDDEQFYVDANNWFEIISKEDPDELGEIYESYDGGIQMLKDLEEDHES